MVDTTSNNKSKDCKDGSCPVDKSGKEKLVKATDLPLVGNPYPPRDVIVGDSPGYLETKVRALRSSVQPILSPLGSAYERTSDFISIGVAHSQSGWERLANSQSSVTNSGIIAGTTLLGLALARRRGIIGKLVFGALGFTVGMTGCYPKDMQEKGRMLMYIAQNKLQPAVMQQYEKLTKGEIAPDNSPKKPE